MLKNALKTVKQYAMLHHGDNVLVGVSGGADSVALLIVLNMIKQKQALTITAAHLNHQIRGIQADREAEFVKKICGDMKIACIAQSRDVPMIKKHRGLSLQEAAREARYEFFLETADNIRASKIALGHNADDQAETLIMRLLRGASLKGLCGIPPVRDRIIRPLITTTRDEIERFLKNLNMPYLPDQSSSEQNYLRNRVRHQLIPILKNQYNPETLSVLCRTAELLRQDHEFIDRELTLWTDRHTQKQHGETYCNINHFSHEPPSMWGGFIMKIIEKHLGNTRKIGYRHIEEIKHLISSSNPSAFTPLPQGLYVLREYDNLVFTAQHPFSSKPFQYTFNELPGTIHIREINRTLRFEICADRNLHTDASSNTTVLLDADKIVSPVCVRNWMDGDRFSPEGLGGSRKIKQLFTDLKIPARLRKQIPILLFGGKIAWVCGVRTDRFFLPDKHTGSVVQVTLE